ncbi:Clr5 domain-containing protein [Lasiosphaeria hispida]|uniref:Clr5 domain-containing protein n=1 Tax=Lasiosphaeria hispida TaxID=260671 RepID=A0AAJ0H594_9PEZI|nr:Clr5 domain-containing protein [Lasiosphaeria hispida]
MPPTSAKGRRPDWEVHRQAITKLYWTQEKTLGEVMETMRQVHGFSATEKQYKKQLVRVWRLAKNINEQDMRAMIRIQKTRREHYVVAPSDVRYSTPEPEVSSRTLPQAMDELDIATDVGDAAAVGLSDHPPTDFSSPEQHYSRSHPMPSSPSGWHAAGYFPEPEPISPPQATVDGRSIRRFSVPLSKPSIPTQPLAGPTFSFEAMLWQDIPNETLSTQSTVADRSVNGSSSNPEYLTAPSAWGFGPFQVCRGCQATTNTYSPELAGGDDSVDPGIQSFTDGPTSWMATSASGGPFHPIMMHDSESNIPSSAGSAYDWPNDQHLSRSGHS